MILPNKKVFESKAYETEFHQLDLLIELYQKINILKKIDKKFQKLKKKLKSQLNSSKNVISKKFEKKRDNIIEEIECILSELNDKSNLYKIWLDFEQYNRYLKNLFKTRKKHTIDLDTFSTLKSEYEMKLRETEENFSSFERKR